MTAESSAAQAVEDLSAYQALYDQFRDDNAIDEVGSLLSLGVQLDDDDDEADQEAGACIVRAPVSDFGDQGFLLRGFLSPGECRQLVAAAEASGGLAGIAGVKPEYRSCQRAVFHEPRLASRLFRRLLPHLPERMSIEGADPTASHRVFGPACLLRGEWRPHCLNPVLRLCRYRPGQHFSPHYDGHLVHSECNRSLQTFMLYLTDNPPGGGGATNFLDDGLTMADLQVVGDVSSGGPQRLSAPPSNVLCSVQPELGAALVFNHYRLHEGEPLTSGVKYILRSDIMYERVAAAAADGGSSGPSESQRTALRLLQEAERLESRGQAAEAVGLYRRAFRMWPELERCT